MSESVTINLNDHTPDTVLPVDAEFAKDYENSVALGASVAAKSRVVFVGMARQIGDILPATIQRLEEIGSRFASWAAVVVENDSTDDTKTVLQQWSDARPGQVVADIRDLGRPHLHGFEGERVARYAEYRNRYRKLACRHFGDFDYVVAVDLDPWGGYSPDGVLHSVQFLDSTPLAGGAASTSLYRTRTDGGAIVWAHYDLWALRLYGPKPRFEPWQPLWLPPPGAPPIRVVSAFGALATYKADAFFYSEYESVDGDIEHVGFHLSLARNGYEMYLNPASRVVMHWMHGIPIPGD